MDAGDIGNLRRQQTQHGGEHGYARSRSSLPELHPCSSSSLTHACFPAVPRKTCPASLPAQKVMPHASTSPRAIATKLVIDQFMFAPTCTVGSIADCCVALDAVHLGEALAGAAGIGSSGGANLGSGLHWASSGRSCPCVMSATLMRVSLPHCCPSLPSMLAAAVLLLQGAHRGAAQVRCCAVLCCATHGAAGLMSHLLGAAPGLYGSCVGCCALGRHGMPPCMMRRHACPYASPCMVHSMAAQHSCGALNIAQQHAACYEQEQRGGCAHAAAACPMHLS